MKWFIALLFLVFALPVFGQTEEYKIEVTTERDIDGKCINWQDITSLISFTPNPDETIKVFPDIPDSSRISTTDWQGWYISTMANDAHYEISFSFTAAGLTIVPKIKYTEYWLRYSKDGILWSGVNSQVVMKPTKPESSEGK